VPAATLPTPADSDVFGGDAPTGPSLVERTTRWLDARLDGIEARQVVLGVVVPKKPLIASALVYLLIG
jgi:hypothetical protein